MLSVWLAVEGVEVIPVVRDVYAQIFCFVDRPLQVGVLGMLRMKLDGDSYWTHSGLLVDVATAA
jgi:hypothetical protein